MSSWQAGETIASCTIMLGTLVDYLRNARVPFRLANYPSEEDRPIAGHPIPERGMLVDTRLLVADGRAILAVFPSEEELDLAAVSTALGGVAVPTSRDGLAEDFRSERSPLPPLGQLLGIPILLDASIPNASMIVFRALGESVYFEVPYEDWARLEQPRVASIAAAGELGAAAAPP